MYEDKKGSTAMKQFRFAMTGPAGIHTRPAGLLVQEARALEKFFQENL